MTTDVHDAIARIESETARELERGTLEDGTPVTLIATDSGPRGEWLTDDGITAHPDDVTTTTTKTDMIDWAHTTAAAATTAAREAARTKSAEAWRAAARAEGVAMTARAALAAAIDALDE